MVRLLTILPLLQRDLTSTRTKPVSYSEGNEFFLRGFLTLEDGADKLSRNVGEGLPLYAA